MKRINKKRMEAKRRMAETRILNYIKTLPRSEIIVIDISIDYMCNMYI